MLVCVQAEQWKCNCHFSYPTCSPIEPELYTFTIWICSVIISKKNHQLQRHYKICTLDLYIPETDCLFRPRPSFCQNVIFQNFPSIIDQNTARFLTNNENFSITWQDSWKLFFNWNWIIGEFRVTKIMPRLMSAIAIIHHKEMARVLRQFNSMTIVKIS